MLGQIAGDLGLLRGRGDGPANATFEEQSDGHLGGWAWTHPKPRNDNRRYNGQIGTKWVRERCHRWGLALLPFSNHLLYDIWEHQGS